MTTLRKRWSALLLAVLMAISLVPMASFPAQAASTTYRLGLGGTETTDISWADLATAGGTITDLAEGDTIVIVSEPPTTGATLTIDKTLVTVTEDDDDGLILEDLTISVTSGSLTLKDIKTSLMAVNFTEDTSSAELTIVDSVTVGSISGANDLTITGESDASLVAGTISASASGVLTVEVWLSSDPNPNMTAGSFSFPLANKYYIGTSQSQGVAYSNHTAQIPWEDVAKDQAGSYYLPGLAIKSTIIFVSDPPTEMSSVTFLIDANNVTLSSYDTAQRTLDWVSLIVDEDVDALTLDRLTMDTISGYGWLSLNTTSKATITVENNGLSKLGAISSLGDLDIKGSGALEVDDTGGSNAIVVNAGAGTFSFNNALTATQRSSGNAINAKEIIFNGTGTSTSGARLTATDFGDTGGNYTLRKGNSVASGATWSSSPAQDDISGIDAKIENVAPSSTARTIWLEAPVRQVGGGGGGSVAATKAPTITLPVNGHRYKTGDTVFIETDAGTGLQVSSRTADPATLTVKLDRPYDVVFAEISPSFLDAWKGLSTSGTLSAPALMPGGGVVEALSFLQYSERITLDSMTPAEGAKRFRLSGSGLTPGRYTVTLTTIRGTVEHAFYYGSGFFLSGLPVPEAEPVLELDAPSTVKANNPIEFKVLTNRSGTVLSYRTQGASWVALPDTLKVSSDWQIITLADGLSKAGTYELMLSCDDPKDTPPVLATLEVVAPFTAQKDGFAFVNTWSSFGYPNGHRIDPELILDVFGRDWMARNADYALSLSYWGGSCHGFSALATTIFAEGMLDEVPDFTTIDIPAPKSKTADLTKTFEAYQVLQGGDFLSLQWQSSLARNVRNVLGTNITQRHKNTDGTNPLRDIVDIVKDCDDGAPPLLLCIAGPMGTGVGGHAIVACKAVEKTPGSGIYAVSIYDCNSPKETRIMTIDLSSAATAGGKLGTWTYDLYDDGRYVWGTDYAKGNQYTEISYYPMASINAQLANVPATFAKYHISGYLNSESIQFSNPTSAAAAAGDYSQRSVAAAAEDAAEGAVIVSTLPMERQFIGLLSDGSVPAGDGSATFFGAAGESYTVRLGDGNAATGKDFSLSLTEGERAASLSTSDKTAGITLDPIGGTASLQSTGGSFSYDFVDTTFASPVKFRASGSSAGDLALKPDGGGYVLSGAAGAVAVEFTREGKTASATITASGDTLVRMERNGTVGSYTYDEASGQYLDANGKPAVIFSDVKVTDWFYDYVNQAYYYGMIEGYGDGTFRPQNALTVAEFVKIAVVAADLTPAAAEGAAWHQPYVAAAEAAGLLKASDAFYGAWDRPILREEMAQVIVRLYKLNYADQLSSLDVSNVSFPDMDSIDPQYLDAVKLAYTLGILRGVDEAGTFQPKSSLLRSEASALITRLR